MRRPTELTGFGRTRFGEKRIVRIFLSMWRALCPDNNNTSFVGLRKLGGFLSFQFLMPFLPLSNQSSKVYCLIGIGRSFMMTLVIMLTPLSFSIFKRHSQNICILFFLIYCLFTRTLYMFLSSVAVCDLKQAKFSKMEHISKTLFTTITKL